MTPEQQCERVRMALAEAGYPDTVVAWSDAFSQVTGKGAVPHEVWWRATAVVGLSKRCWPCYSDAPWTPAELADPCDHDPLTSPWPDMEALNAHIDRRVSRYMRGAGEIAP